MPDRFFNLSLNLLCIAGSDGYFKRLNPAWEKTLGFQTSKLLAQPYIEFVHPEDREATIAEIRKLQTGVETISFENRYLCQDGSYKWLAWNATLSSKKRLMYAVVCDTTQQKQAEQALRLQMLYAHSLQERLQPLLSHGSAVLYICKANGDFGATFISDNVKTLLGYEPWEFTEDSSFWANHIHPEDAPRVFQGLSHLLETGHHCHEYRFQYKDGTYHWMHDELKLLGDEAGNPLEIVGCWRDITAEKQAELAVKASEERLKRVNEELEIRVKERTSELSNAIQTLESEIAERQLSEAALKAAKEQLETSNRLLQSVIEGTSEPIFVKNLQGRYLLLNSAGAQILGKSIEEVIGKDDTELFPPEVARPIIKTDRCIMRSGNPQILEEMVTVNGIPRIYLSSKHPYRDREGKIIGLVGIAWDITERKQAEKAQARLTAILETTTDFVSTADAQGNVLYLNRAGRVSMGISEDEDISTLNMSALCGSSAIELMLHEGVPAAIRDGVWSGETAWQYRNGPEIPVSQVIMAHKGEDGTVEFFSTIARDISDRKQAEAAMQASEAQYRRIVETATEGIWMLDVDGKTSFVNPQMASMLGYSVEEMLGQTLFAFMDAEGQAIAQANLERRRQGISEQHDFKFTHKDGSDMWAIVSTNAIFDSEGNYAGALGMITDITERKQVEFALQQREEQLRQLVQNMPVMMNAFDENFSFIVWNRECERVTGYSAEEIVGNSKTLELLYPNPAYRNSILTSLAEKGNNYRDWELDITTKDGTIKTIAWSNISAEFPIPGWAVWGIGLDVTERKQAETALAERARLAAFRADVDTALTQSDTLQGILQRCTEAVVEHLNAAFARIWTLNADQNVLELQASAGMYTHLDGPHCRVPVGQFKIGRIAQECQPHLTNCVLEDPYIGDREWAKREDMVAFAGYPLIVDDQLVGVIAMFARHPLAEPTLSALEFAADEIAIGIKRKQAEEALRHSEARFRKLAQREELLNRLASDIRNSLDVDTILETAVIEIRNLLQIDRCLFVWYRSHEDQFIWDIVHEAKQSTLPSLVGQHPAQEDVFTQKFLSKELLCVDDLSVATDPALKGIYINLGYTAILTLPIGTPSGTVGLLSCGHHSEPRPWKEDEVELLQAVTDQIAIALSQAELYTQAQNAAQQAQQQTQQLQETLHQLQQTQAQLIQTEKMSSLGQMVAGVAHEINNPVNFIYGNLIHAEQYTQDLLHLLHLYQQHYPHPPAALQEAAETIDLDFLIEDLPKLLGSMKMGADRIRQIILSLRNFSRLDEADMKAVNIHEGIDNTLLILQNRLKAKLDRPAIEIIKEYGNLPLVECYAGQLNQVFMNILNNAIDALELLPSRRVELLENSTSPCHPTIRIHTEVKDRDCIFVSIADNGPGMTEAIKARLFDPFFTTKPVGKGTGLGLSISYQIIVEKHGGALKCISQPGQGSEFWIKIPICQGKC